MTVVHRGNYKPNACLTPDKKKFYDEESAQDAVDRIERNRGQMMTFYQCGKHWHLTKFRRSRMKPS